MKTKLQILALLISSAFVSESVAAPQTTTSLNHIAVSIGWDKAPLGEKMDLDISAFLVKPDGKMRSDDASDFCFYSNKVIADGAIKHTGDNSSGDGNGDDETIIVESSKIPAEMDKVIFTVTFNNDEELKHKFSRVWNTYVRIVNNDTGVELARYDLNKVAPNESTIIFGELYRSGADWKFRVLNKGFAGGLGAISKLFGVASYYSGQ